MIFTTNLHGVQPCTITEHLQQMLLTRYKIVKLIERKHLKKSKNSRLQSDLWQTKSAMFVAY